MTKKIDSDIIPGANLENLKKQAKSLLKKALENNPHALSRLDRARAIEPVTNQESNTEYKLVDAQLAIVRENGAATWNELKQTVESGLHKPTDLDSSLSVKGIDQIWLDCTDLQKAENFYGEILGLSKTAEVPGQMMFFNCGGVNLLLGLAEKVRPNSILYLKIGESEQEIQDSYNQLKLAGVKVGDPPHCLIKNWQGFDVWMAFFEDPFGNQLAFKCNVPAD